MNRHSIITTITTAALALLCPLSIQAQGKLPINARITLDKNEIYERETVFFTLVITTTGIQFRQNLNLINLPDEKLLNLYSKFETLPIKRIGNGSRITEIHRYRCRARSMTPGTIDIAPILQLSIMRRQRGFIGSVWREQAVKIQIPTVTLKVKPLPHSPKNFSGAVGTLNFNASITPSDIALGDLITLTTHISGRGYTENITIPQLHNSEQLKVYDTKKVEVPDTNNSKIYKQIIIPKTTNLTAIPKIDFTYFDTRSSSYKTISAGPFPIKYHAATKAVIEEFHPENLPNAPKEKPQSPESIKKSITKTVTKARYKQAICHTKTPAHIAPSEASLITFTIPAKGEINILTKYKNWLKVEFKNQRGWIQATDIKQQKKTKTKGTQQQGN